MHFCYEYKSRVDVTKTERDRENDAHVELRQSVSREIMRDWDHLCSSFFGENPENIIKVITEGTQVCRP